MQDIALPLIGGMIIGLATSIMLAFNGKITGISGIISQSLEMPKAKNYWRYMFLAGLLAGGTFMLYFSPQYFFYSLNFSLYEAIAAGLFVGVGAVLGSGCTSGHGVCGLARLSGRSFAATLIFMGMAIVTVFIRGLL